MILGHEEIGDYEMNVLRRVARDTANQKRQKIVDALSKEGLNQSMSLTDIANRAPGLHYKTASNQIILMEALDIVEKNPNTGNFKLTDSFRPLVESIHIPPPTVKEIKKPENGFFSALTGGEDILDPDDPRYKLHQDGIELLTEQGGEMDLVIFFSYMFHTKGHPMEAVEAMVRTSGRIELLRDKVRLIDTRGERDE